ncbi:hypothetical protein CC2G_001488 [Coprinopsis cinerea AmutBmut pab1-1]|nr:hypothetical protein CC2G_001488 [Coprinopsis cinerea AmutBmut pab1-1]
MSIYIRSRTRSSPIARSRRGEAEASSGSRNITWIAPQSNQTYPAGQTLVAKWDTLLALILPSFQLCVGEDGVMERVPETRCGSMVNPSVQQQIDGLYFVSLAVPNITSAKPFILRMQDTLGYEFDSPPFYLGQVSAGTIAAQENSTDSTAPTQPQETPSLPAGILFNLTDVDTSASDSDPLLVLQERRIGRYFKRQDSDFGPFSPGGSPTLATLLVPLAIVGVSLLLALFLCFRRHRQKELRPLILTEKRLVHPDLRRPSVSFKSGDDLESAVSALERERAMGRGRESPFDAVSRNDVVLPSLPFDGSMGHSPTSSSFAAGEEEVKRTMRESVSDLRSRSLTDSYFSSVPALPSSPILQQRHLEGIAEVVESDAEGGRNGTTLYEDSTQRTLPRSPLPSSPPLLVNASASLKSPIERLQEVNLASPPLPAMMKLSEMYNCRTRSKSPNNGGTRRSPLRVKDDLEAGVEAG